MAINDTPRRLKLTDDEIIQACEDIAKTGRQPTNKMIVKHLGRGSFSQTSPVLRAWLEKRKQHEQPTSTTVPADVKELCAQLAPSLWAAAIEKAEFSMQAERRELAMFRQDCDNTLIALETEFAQLSAQYEERGNIIDDLTVSSDTLKGDLVDAKRELALMGERYASSQAESAALKAELMQVTDTLGDAQQQIGSLSIAKQLAEQSILQLQEDHRKADLLANQLNAELASSQSEARKLNEDLSVAKHALDELKNRFEAVSVSLQTTQAALQESQRQVILLGQTLTQQQDQNEKLVAELQVTKEEKEGFASIINSRDISLALLGKDKDDLLASMAALKAEREELLSTIDTVKQQNQSLAIERAGLLAKIDAHEQLLIGKEGATHK